jgi:hypothetical protein
MATDSTARPLPGSYSEMYPGRFLKADMLKGRQVTVTITEIEGEDLVGENNKTKSEWIVRIKERSLQLVLNKTNAFCLYRMFGGDPHSWIGKRITIFPTTTKFGRNTVDAIRVFGSPDIAEDMEITVPQGRKKAWETVMHKVATKGASAPAQATAPDPAAADIDPRIIGAINILDLTPKEQADYLAARAGKSTEEILADINAEIDRRDSQEAQ